MAKPSTARKMSARAKPSKKEERLHDIINKVKDNQKLIDDKLLELSLICMDNQRKVR